jgi:hypothetical protein
MPECTFRMLSIPPLFGGWNPSIIIGMVMLHVRARLLDANAGVCLVRFLTTQITFRTATAWTEACVSPDSQLGKLRSKRRMEELARASADSQPFRTLSLAEKVSSAMSRQNICRYSNERAICNTNG